MIIGVSGAGGLGDSFHFLPPVTGDETPRCDVLLLLSPLLCSGLLLSPAPAVLVQDEVPPGSVARVNGALVDREAYHDWLIRTRAPLLLDDYLQQVLVEQACALRGLRLPADERAQALERHWQRLVLDTYAGLEERAIEALEAVGSSRQERLDLDRAKVEFEALAGKLVRAMRAPTEEQLRILHQRRFGDQGRRVELRLAFFRRYRDLREGETMQAEQAEQARDLARARAEDFAAGLAGAEPEQAAALVGEQSDVLRLSLHLGVFQDLRQAGGHLPYYRPSLFQGQLEPAIAEAAVGEVVGPIETPDGQYVALVLRREDAPFEQVRGELEQQFLDAPVTPKELYLLRAELAASAKIQKGRALLPEESQGR